MKRAAWICAAAFLVIASGAGATEIRSGERIVVASDEVIEDDLLAAGTSVVVRGVVEGDLIAFGNRVAVPGHVKGSMMAAAQSLSLTGKVDGSARLAGQTVAVRGEVGRNLAAAGSDVSLEGSVGKDAHLAGATLGLDGPVGRAATLAGASVGMAGPVGGDVKVWCDDLALDTGADIAGNLVYQSPKELTKADAAQVGGKITRLVPKVKPKPERPRRGGVWPLLLALAALVGWMGLTVFVTGVIMLAVVPRYATDAANAVVQPAWKSLLFGFLVLLVVPVSAVIACMTIVGIPLGVIALMLYAAALWLSGIPVAISLGRWPLQRLRAGRAVSPYLALLVGVIILVLIGWIPIVGGLVPLAVVLFGLGAWSRVAKGVLMAGRAPASA